MQALAVAAEQQQVISFEQLERLGFTTSAIRHALRSGRFYLVRPGVVTIGRPDVTPLGRLKAVELAFPHGIISHTSAAAVWEISPAEDERTHLTVCPPSHPRASDIRVHRRDPLPRSTRCNGIRVTAVLETLIDLAATKPPAAVEFAVNEADKKRLLRIDGASAQLADMAPRRGTRALANVLARHTVTDSQLELRFLGVVRMAGLPAPETPAGVNGFRVDFYWPQLGLVVETDGLTYHRTPAQQARDRLRDQAHTAAGLTCLRFTNEQVRRDPASVASLLKRVAARLNASVRIRSL